MTIEEGEKDTEHSNSHKNDTTQKQEWTKPEKAGSTIQARKWAGLRTDRIDS